MCVCVYFFDSASSCFQQEGREGAWHVGAGASGLAPELIAFCDGITEKREVSHALDVFTLGLIVGWLLIHHGLGSVCAKVTQIACSR